MDQTTDSHLAGNSGIGYQTALQLALRHARVYISSRSEERVNKAIDEMKEVAGSVELDLRFLQMDLQNLKSVKSAANSFRQRETRLDLLINNAGV
jgi:NAD(P)-dependent dehydrogenase (short-subunit alcohol dehydrogenase family)